MVENTRRRSGKHLGGWLLALGAGIFSSGGAQAAPVIAAAFSADYTLTDLGPVSGVPDPYGGLVFKSGGTDTILLGGTANQAEGGMYSVTVTRGLDGHITGIGAGSLVTAAPFND